MTTGRRALRDTIVRALAKVGLVWSVAVLGALFITMSAHAQDGDGGTAGSSSGTVAGGASLPGSSADGPSTAGLALALVVLGAGVTVLAVGATRGDRGVRDQQRKYAGDPDTASDLPLAVGVSLLA